MPAFNSSPDLIFDRDHALEAIKQAQANGPDWLYSEYRTPGGNKRKSSTGFLMHGGVSYAVKPLGRLANAIAGRAMRTNLNTKAFRKHFESLGFQLITSSADEAKVAAERQRRLANVWARPEQAKFRRAVFELFGARCLITGCETLTALEAAHVLPVGEGGGDEGWNGIPLRADLHRLFDANELQLDPSTWTFSIADAARRDYSQYHGLNVGLHMSGVASAQRLAVALRGRQAQLGPGLNRHRNRA